MRTPSTAALVLAVGLGLASCTDRGDDGGLSPQERLEQARTVLDEAASIELSLSTEELPRGVDGVLAADGVGTHAPAFEGTIDISASGFAGEAEVVAVDGRVWTQLPFTSQFIVVDPAAYGAPDPAALLATEGGLSSLLTAVVDPTEQGQRRDGERVVTEIAGTLPGAAIAELFPSAAADGTFDASFEVTDDNELAAATLYGPFYTDADPVAYDVTLDARDEPVEITAPR